ncbi:acetoin dehydrogenase dihydrolipoyllysine-residue acetyltransferase subunit [Acetobacter orleanensis]|uniref:Branched-chain alpha-keto acid dehydrogenase subunit E2 n=1 Tax=Acetobacter orleanensis TaxID=104099 RepID=A0A4Y3TIW2_9PROT|nr:acetoin dehydrogenase dihydrolipoyllysine-residue acetyltransferase subunit [Acetobacter orleanensis]KXV65196.1 acetoin dehydrogenase [Acetobacter orleanensis]PCD79662.1 acetoin dehydrogenase dihydrolipoyllysine-residue acetyltransferase subunit [Acetobacter orleanensis]GAN68770.1 branched-chain alpha-keto acid dehydrogenase subunit E2 [Acetobacter orleanensis JCM 7639]GBR28076.1 branched-chain alpha-keto acid dehydrogenase subunit E2 [Acetobacter orleanensis NRIC 0473]GEB82256.1 branched-c
MTHALTALTMPKFGLAMTEGKLASWAFSPGDTVKEGDEVADIETSKITSGYESPASGILRKQVAQAGETLPVGALLGVVADADVSDADIEAFIASFKADTAEEGGEEAEAANTEPRLIKAGDHNLNVRDVGKGGSAPLLLIHGFGGDLSNWMLNQDVLARSHRVITFDLPGHGASSKDVGDGSVTALADAVSELLKALNISSAHVMGHSLGGGIALALLRDNPGVVASLTLVAPAGLGREVNAPALKDMVEADRTRDMQKALEALVHDKSLVGRKMADNVLKVRRLDGARDALRTIEASCFGNGQQSFDMRPVLDAARVPVTLFWGEEDEILPVTGAKNVPDSVTKHIMPKIGHMPQLEKTAELNRLVEAFLEKSHVTA